jgi:hypothetical protein
MYSKIIELVEWWLVKGRAGRNGEMLPRWYKVEVRLKKYMNVFKVIDLLINLTYSFYIMYI